MRTGLSNRSDSVSALLNPTHGVRDEIVRKGGKPHNHAKDNRTYIKQLQKLNRERTEAAAAATAATTPRPGSAKYKGVGSRVTKELSERPTSAPPHTARRPLEARNFMGGAPKWQPNQAIAAGWKQAEPMSKLDTAGEEQLKSQLKLRKPAVPKPDMSPRAPTAADFVQRNASAAKVAQRRSAPPSTPPAELKHKSFGGMPPYLLDRKLALAEAKAEREAAIARRVGVPAGHHILPEEVRPKHTDPLPCCSPAPCASMR